MRPAILENRTEHCVPFLDPLIESWGIDRATLGELSYTADSVWDPEEIRVCWSIERSVASSRTAYDLGNRLRRLALPVTIQSWSLTSLRQRLFKTGGPLPRNSPAL